MKIAAIRRATAPVWRAALALSAGAGAGAARLKLPVSGDGGLSDQICQARK